MDNGQNKKYSFDPLDVEIAKIWLASQDLSAVTPEQAKLKFYEILQKLERIYPERWD